MGSSMSTAAHSMEHVPDDALGEVLVRVPPHPANLARASLACKSLHRFIGGAEFHRSFQEHHKSTPPPLLGFFHDDESLPNNFLPIRDSPDRVSSEAFDPKDHGWRLVDSRHGRVLLRSPDRARFLVWDPAAGRRRYIDAPPLNERADSSYYCHDCHADHSPMSRFSNAAVVCAAPGHVDHSDCHDCPFNVVFVASPPAENTVVYLYSSELGLWNEVASADFSSSWIRISDRPVALVRNVLYWTMITGTMGMQCGILAFDLQTHRLYLIQQPAYVFDADEETVQVMETVDGLLGLVAACGFSLELWVLREYNGRGTERWGMPKQIDLGDLAVGLPDLMDPLELYIVWILNVEGRFVFLRTEAGIFQVDLLAEVPNKKICDAYDIQAFYPYKSFYYRGI